MSTGFVYFIQAGENGPIKIGWSENPEMRLAQLQGAHHEDLSLLLTVNGDKALEGRLHFRLEQHRLRGEWFADCDEVRAAMEEVATPRRTRPLGLENSVRVQHLILIDQGWHSLLECATEDEAADVMAAIGRDMFRAVLEFKSEAAA
jgi:hypothetical protein